MKDVDIMTAIDHAKRAVWYALIYPVFPLFRELFILLRRLFKGQHHRDPFILGILRSKHQIEEFITHLRAKGFDHCSIAWRDSGQLASLRLLVGFHWQYHLRIFEDGEVRGHYEKTPEAYPFDHLLEKGLEARREEFMGFLAGWIVPMKPKGVRVVK